LKRIKKKPWTGIKRPGTGHDFAIRIDDKEPIPQISERIIERLIRNRLKAKKPVIIFIGGDSGEGKSSAALKIQEILLRSKGLDLKDYIHDINVYTPLEYPQKLRAILHDKRLKNIDILCMHEAREIVKAKKWQSFLTQAISDVNAMSRSIRPLCIFIVSQFIRDITNDIRYTLTFYGTVSRRFYHDAELRLYKLFKDDYDLEKPRLKKRKVFGYLINTKNKYTLYRPDHVKLAKPNKEIFKEFEERDKQSKIIIIRNKLNKLIKEMKADMGVESHKVEAMVKYYTDNPESLQRIGKVKRKKFELFKDVKDMHDLSPEEADHFQKKLNEAFEKMHLEVLGDERDKLGEA
jgi:hypothetical protein